MGYLRTQLLEIIEWQDESRDTISFRYPDMNKEIKRGAQLIRGKLGDVHHVYPAMALLTDRKTGRQENRTDGE